MLRIFLLAWVEGMEPQDYDITVGAIVVAHDDAEARRLVRDKANRETTYEGPGAYRSLASDWLDIRLTTCKSIGMYTEHDVRRNWTPRILLVNFKAG